MLSRTTCDGTGLRGIVVSCGRSSVDNGPYVVEDGMLGQDCMLGAPWFRDIMCAERVEMVGSICHVNQKVMREPRMEGV